MRTYRYLLVSVLLVSTGCSLGGSDHVTERMAIDASIVSAAPVCTSTQPSFTLAGSSTGISHLKTPLPPVVTIERSSDGAVTATDATIIDDTHVAVVAQKTLGPGSYNVRVKRQNDNAEVLLESALTVVAVPKLTAIGVCRAASGPLALHLTGSGLSAVTLALVASDGSSTAFVGTEASETGVRAPLPASVKEEVGYTLRVTSGVGCTATHSFNLATMPIAKAPIVTGFSVGPKAKNGNIQKQSRLGVAVRGTFAAGTQIVVRGGDSATQLPATLSEGTLSARASSGFAATGVYAISVDTQGCVASVGNITVEDAPPELASALAHVRFSPSASALVAGRIVDVFADASLGSNVHIDIDANPSVTAEDFFAEMVSYQTLDKDGRALRTALRTTRAGANSGLSVLRVRSNLGEYLLDDAFTVLGDDTVEAKSDPRIVKQERDWVRAGMVQSIYVEGCDLQGARVVLRRESDGQETQLTTSGFRAGDAFTIANFRCTHGSGATRATDSLVLTTPDDLPAGIYRLRVYRQTAGAFGGFFDALYPTVLYRDAPRLAGPNGALFEVSAGAATTLSVPRRGPASAIGSDEEGRKYVYVVGGALEPTMNPASVSAAATTYEYAPVAPDHTLLPFIQIQGETDQTFPLQFRVGNANATTLAAAYAGALAAAGSQLYLAGGTKDGNAAIADVFAAKILTDATTPGALAPFSRGSTTAQLFGGTDCIANTGTFGASAAISRVGANRALVVAGGVISAAYSTRERDAITCTSLFTLTPSGDLPDSVKAGGALPSAQAFAASLTDISGSVETPLAFVGGYNAIDQSYIYPRPSGYFLSSNTPFSGLTSRALKLGWIFYQPGLFHAGATIFALGGGYIDSSSLVEKVIKTTLTAGAPKADGADVAFTAQSTALKHTRAAFALSHLAPHIYVHGGVRCRQSDDTCDGKPLELATDTEHGLLTP